MGFEKYKKWIKVDTCFSFNKGIRDAGSTADFRILFEILKLNFFEIWKNFGPLETFGTF